MKVPSEVTTTGEYAGSTGRNTTGRNPNVFGFGCNVPPLATLTASVSRSSKVPSSRGSRLTLERDLFGLGAFGDLWSAGDLSSLAPPHSAMISSAMGPERVTVLVGPEVLGLPLSSA